MKKIIHIASAAIAIITGLCSAIELADTKPNIIFVLTDDQGMGDLSCMGNPILKTPHIDAFYEKSTRFTEFHVSPTCAPTRSALMSGTFPFNTGVTHTILQRERMALSIHTLPQMLKSAGYSTGLFGKWHLGDQAEYLPQSRGFDEVLMHGSGGIGQVGLGDFAENRPNTYFDNVLLHNDKVVKTEGFCTDVFFDAAEAWIHTQEKAEVPYFAYISLNAPHGPFYAPEKSKERFITEGYDKKTAARYGMIENIDDNFGEMMEKLKKWNALENTLVIFMTDNGMSMPEIKRNKQKQPPFNANMRGKKNTPYQGGTRVPSFWYWDKFSEPKDIPALTAHVDMYKTFQEISGADLPEKMQKIEGRSLLPLLADAKAPWPDRTLYTHCARWGENQREKFKFTKCAIRTTRWKLVDGKELYDISNDPAEATDVIDQFPEIAADLKKRYNQWWESTLPFMVNEGLPKLQLHPFHQLAEQQKTDTGFPLYEPNK